ncbi:class I SAM-dependent methyltransferase [Pseudomonadota bacterium]|nr:class I SAM-dependent methyltransferase [Pseudomonadota bacterium]
MIKVIFKLAESGWLPDVIIKIGAKFLSQKRLADPSLVDQKKQLLKDFAAGAIAEETAAANEQHYEVPPKFFQQVLGQKLKYSCSLYNLDGTKEISLDEAEINMLNLYLKRAGIQSGQNILDLGCGWGSFSLYAAEQFPESTFTAVSNSSDQIAFINAQAKDRDLKNLTAIRQDVNNLQFDQQFDRIVSIEMFEHLRNYDSILKTLNSYLKDDGKLFIHIFCHKEHIYLYEIKHDFDWMTKYFFLGGVMPSLDIFSHFPKYFEVENRWEVNGNHYSITSKDWLRKHVQNKKQIMQIFAAHYDNPSTWYYRWKIFFLTCEVFFALNNGEEYFVSHHLLKKNID